MALPPHLDFLVGGRNASNTRALNSALIISTLDVKVPLITPVFIPAVGDLPVRNAILHTPANQADGMTTKATASDVTVHTALVGGEVLIHVERHLKGPMCHQLPLVALLCLHTVRLGALILNHFIAAVQARCVAGRGVVKSAGTSRVAITVGVVAAGREGVGLAALRREADVDPPHPRRGRNAAIATHAANEAARQQVASGDASVRDVGNGAVAIRYRLCRSNSPARTAVGLVTNLSNGRAVGPLLSRVEGFRNILRQLLSGKGSKG